MKSRTYATALVLSLALALLVTFTPVLAHPYWGGETGEQVIPPWMGDYEDMPHWYNNGTISQRATITRTEYSVLVPTVGTWRPQRAGTRLSTRGAATVAELAAGAIEAEAATAHAAQPAGQVNQPKRFFPFPFIDAS